MNQGYGNARLAHAPAWAASLCYPGVMPAGGSTHHDDRGAAGGSLTGLAFDLLRVAGQPLAPDTLACRVFGLTSPTGGGRWVHLLETVLAADDRFARMADGWGLAPEPTDTPDGTVVALAI